MDNFIGNYKGYPIYSIKFNDFMALSEKERMSRDVIYMIEEDRRVITNGNMFGSVSKDGKRLDGLKATPYPVAYAARIALEERKRREEKRNKMMATPTKKVTAAVVTERPTVENLAKAGEEKLQEIQHDAADALDKLNLEALEKTEEVLGDAAESVAAVENKVEEVVAELTAEGEAKLTALADEGEKQVAAVKKRKPRVKTTTTTAE